MSSVTASAPDVFSAREIARAAGVSAKDVRRLIDAGRIASLDGRFVGPADAVHAVRSLRSERGTTEPAANLFRQRAPARRSSGRALTASAAIHATVILVIGFVTGLNPASAPVETRPSQPVRLVFLPTPGPGGGGGGGGLRQPARPPRAEIEGRSALRSPVPPPRRPVEKRAAPRASVPPPPVRPTPVERPVEPPRAPPAPEPLPRVVAPVATVAADGRDRPGVLESASDSASNGPGSGGGAGSGQGTGIGEGDGPGIGPGSGGGTGGGPYRPGSGITPPAILREVKPDYPEEARRRGVEGDVELEIVVRRDGSVGGVRLLRGLGAGLDQRAIEAVRQWRFSPAHRHGTAVDVMVEVAVEFRLR